MRKTIRIFGKHEAPRVKHKASGKTGQVHGVHNFFPGNKPYWVIDVFMDDGTFMYTQTKEDWEII